MHNLDCAHRRAPNPKRSAWPTFLSRVSHSECTYMDPQSRVLLEQTQACMADAKLGLGHALASNCGVCVGAPTSPRAGWVLWPWLRMSIHLCGGHARLAALQHAHTLERDMQEHGAVKMPALVLVVGVVGGGGRKADAPFLWLLTRIYQGPPPSPSPRPPP